MDTSIALSILSIFISIMGWVCVEALTRTRIKSQEWRSLARNLINPLNKTVQLSILYHMNDTRRKDFEEDIYCQLDSIDLKLVVLIKKLKLKNTSFRTLRSAITLDNFATCRFEQKKRNDKIIRTIRIEANKLITTLYSSAD